MEANDKLLICAGILEKLGMRYGIGSFLEVYTGALQREDNFGDRRC
jgi:hypothetical protein